MKTAFLIEGMRSVSDDPRSPDVRAGIALAKANGSEVFDAIHSYDEEHLPQAFLSLVPEKQSLLAAHILVAFGKEGGFADIVDKIIKPGYQKLITDGKVKELPKWLENLNGLTANTFFENVLKKHFDGELKNFKQWNKKFFGELITLSNTISQQKFIEYLDKNKDITTVYTLIGEKHIPFLDKVGKVLDATNDTRHIQVERSRQVVDIFLFGGYHGKLAHYEKMEEHAKSRGLTIPARPVENKSPFDTKLLLKILGHVFFKEKHKDPAKQFQAMASKEEIKVRHEESSSWRKHLVLERDPVEKFDYWMTHYNHSTAPENQKGHSGNKEKLLQWLLLDGGAELISTYEEFRAMASKLVKKGYNTDPAPSKEEFEKGITKYENRYGPIRKSAEEIKVKHEKPSSWRKHLVLERDPVEKFDYWMKEYNHNEEISDNQELVDWLSADKGAELISTYEEFRAMASKLAKKGYNTDPAPSKEEFEKGVAEFERSKRRKKDLVHFF